MEPLVSKNCIGGGGEMISLDIFFGAKEEGLEGLCFQYQSQF